MALLIALAGCRGGGEPTTPPPPPAPPPPPPNPAVELFDLIPTQANVVLVVEVGALRRSNHGQALLGVVRRLAMSQAFERQSEIDLAADVERLVVFGEVDPERGSRGDLANIMNRMSVRTGGMVAELGSTLANARGQCHQEDLAGVQLEPIEGPMENTAVGRCGQFVIASCCVTEPAGLSRQSSAAARALALAPGPLPGADRVAAAVWGPGALSRASCEPSVIELTGWQTAVADFGQGVTVRGRIHAASPNDAPALRECVEGGVAEIAGYPILQQLGVGGLFSAVEVTQDPADDKDVLIVIPLDAQQTEFVMSLVELIGGGGAP
jgi:hypothetical protein